MTPEHLHRLIVTVADAVIEHEPEFTTLDQAIGDGDHGLNMRRGAAAVRSLAEELAGKPLPEALTAIGNQLVSTIGGAAGPLYGTLLLALGRELAVDGSNFPLALAAAVDAVMARGRSQAGQKTMLDVLTPVQRSITAGGTGLARRLPAIACDAANATGPMRATRGRAAYLGERSVGHVDPGARSAAVIVAAGCGVWEA